MHFSPTSTQRALITGVAAAAVVIGAYTFGTAATGPAAAAPPAAPAGARITVTGTGTVSGTPNQLTLSMGVQTSGSTVSAALASANHAVRAVTSALTRTGVQPSDIATSGLSIYPNYGNSSQAPVSYQVSESVQVTLRTLATAGSQISRAVRAGGNATVVDGVSLNLSDSSSLLSAARARAVADARTKASEYARALGRSLGPVVTMSEQAPAQPYPVFANASASGAAQKSPVPVSPGTQQVTVTVTVIFALA